MIDYMLVCFQAKALRTIRLHCDENYGKRMYAAGKGRYKIDRTTNYL